MTVYKENLSWDNNNIYQHKYEDTTRRMTGFFKLMARWKNSCIKLMYHNLIIFLLLYYLISLIYRFVLKQEPQHRQMFEFLCVYAGRNMDKIPLNFLIGFYVQQAGLICEGRTDPAYLAGGDQVVEHVHRPPVP